jgi:hypothetical protein
MLVINQLSGANLSCEADSRSVCLEMPLLVCSAKVYHRFRKNPPLDAIKGRINLVHKFTLHFLKVQFVCAYVFQIILPLRFSDQRVV